MSKFFVLKSCIFVLIALFCSQADAQSTVFGLIRDSITENSLGNVGVSFENSQAGVLTSDQGEFKLKKRERDTTLVLNLMGYRIKKIKIASGNVNLHTIYLSPNDIKLQEIVVSKGRGKYSKKNNPAVELIKKVIARKYDNLSNSQSYYQDEEYEHLLVALNDYKEETKSLKSLPFLSKYATTSLIDNKRIVPISVRETLSSFYYRKKPEATKRIITAHHVQGFDQGMNLETIDAAVKQVFSDVDIRDDNIVVLLHAFVGPLSSSKSINFYKWYIIDTLQIDNKPYINLGFLPFNNHDVGFSGNIYVAADSTYALKRVSVRVPNQVNVNFVDEMLIRQEFQQDSVTNTWVRSKSILAIDMSIEKQLKIYVEKVKYCKDWIFNQPIDPVFINPAPEIYVNDYEDKNSTYWAAHKPAGVKSDYLMKDMMVDLSGNKLLDFAVKALNIVSTGGYIATSKEPKKNKLDLGTLPTMFSFNPLEGARFRLTAATNANMNKHFFLYAYLAYGAKDKKTKYNAEATWSFKECKYHQDEYPINKLTISQMYDVNPLGQTFGEMGRDNILMSGSRGDNKMTYDLMNKLEYRKEYYGGFSLSISANTEKETPAGGLRFQKMADTGGLCTISNLNNTYLGMSLRYAPKEKFAQQRRVRYNTQSRNNIIFNFSYVDGLKGVLGSDYAYHKASFSIYKETWIAPYGEIYTTLSAEKIWGSASFPLLISPNANTSFLTQNASFYMLHPLEFINDAQFTWDVSYKMGGWLFNRIPLIKKFKWREIFGFRGFYGSLSDRNQPQNNHDLFIFPADSHAMGKHPYMEANVGISNILKIFRVDYFHRFSYLDIPGSKKNGFRISLSLDF